MTILLHPIHLTLPRNLNQETHLGPRLEVAGLRLHVEVALRGLALNLVSGRAQQLAAPQDMELATTWVNVVTIVTGRGSGNGQESGNDTVNPPLPTPTTRRHLAAFLEAVMAEAGALALVQHQAVVGTKALVSVARGDDDEFSLGPTILSYLWISTLGQPRLALCLSYQSSPRHPFWSRCAHCSNPGA